MTVLPLWRRYPCISGAFTTWQGASLGRRQKEVVVVSNFDWSVGPQPVEPKRKLVEDVFDFDDNTPGPSPKRKRAPSASPNPAAKRYYRVTISSSSSEHIGLAQSSPPLVAFSCAAQINYLFRRQSHLSFRHQSHLSFRRQSPTQLTLLPSSKPRLLAPLLVRARVNTPPTPQKDLKAHKRSNALEYARAVA